jgi:hypothetical protein
MKVKLSVVVAALFAALPMIAGTLKFEYSTNKADAIYKAGEKGGGEQTLVDVHDQIKDLLRHEARGRAMDAFVAELRENAVVEYR